MLWELGVFGFVVTVGLAALFWLNGRARRAYLADLLAGREPEAERVPVWRPPVRAQPTATAAAWRSYATEVEVLDADDRPLPATWSPTPSPAPARAPAWEVARYTPQRAPSPASDLAVPLGQAFGLALAVAVGGALVAWALEWSWRVVAVGAGCVLIAATLWRLRVADGLLQVVETATGLDLNNDGAIGAQAHLVAINAPAARSAVMQANHAAEDAAKLKELEAFVKRCYAVGTSESAQGIKPGDRAQYLEKRDLLMSLGLATWRQPGNQRAGWRMTVGEREALEVIRRHVVTVGTTTHPDDSTM